MKPDASINVLLIDDDEVDIMTVRRSLRAWTVPHTLTVAREARAGLGLLRGDGGHAPLPRPCLILLDLNLPAMNGQEFLEELRRDPDHGDSLVFVLTTSDAERDRRAAYKHHVAGYMLKSDLGPDFAPLSELLTAYCKVMQLP